MPILYSDPEMKNIFPEGNINIIYKRNKSLRQLISASRFPQAQVKSHSMVSKFKSKRCDIFQNYLVYNLHAQLLTKYIMLEVSCVVLVQM